MLSVERLMKSGVVAVTGGTTVAEAARRMADSGIGAVLIFEGDAPVGIFSERDLLTRVVAQGRDPAATPVSEVATPNIVHADAGASLKECAALLRDHGIRHLPVLDGRKAVGMLSARDFFEAVAGGFERLFERARYDEALREDRDPYDHLGGSYGR